MNCHEADTETDPCEYRRLGRAWPRPRFRLRTLLLIPVVVAALLLIAFPKLLTGDFIEATVVSIENRNGRVHIEMDARISSGTTWGATLYGGYFGTLGTSGRSRPSWTGIIPTWPKSQTLLIDLRIRDNALPQASDPLSKLAVKPGETYLVTDGRPLELAPGSCRLKAWRGSRLGL